MTEIQDYNPSIKPKYRCKLCIASLRDTTVVAHLKGLPHKMKYFVSINRAVIIPHLILTLSMPDYVCRCILFLLLNKLQPLEDMLW